MLKYLNKDLKELLLQYDITDQDIKGSGKNGAVLKSDREKIFLKLMETDTIESVPKSDHGIIDDLLYQILLQSDVKDISKLCMINTTSMKICHNQHFWIEKLKQDGISYTLPLPITLYEIIQMIKINMARSIGTSIVNYFNGQPNARKAYKHEIFLKFEKNINKLIKLLNSLNVIVDGKLFKSAQLIFKIGLNGKWYLSFYGIYHDKRKKTYYNTKYDLSDKEVIDYLAILITYFPDVDISTDFHQNASYYDLIKNL